MVREVVADLVQASAGAKHASAAELAPPRPRPKTTAVVAQRLIGSALQVDSRLWADCGQIQSPDSQ